MKNIAFLLLFVCSTVYAGDVYISEKADGTVRQTYYVGGSQDSISDVLRDIGVSEAVKVKDTDLPDRKDDKYWKLQGDSVVVDEGLKLVDIENKAKEEKDKKAVLAKLKISEEELGAINKRLLK